MAYAVSVQIHQPFVQIVRKMQFCQEMNVNVLLKSDFIFLLILQIRKQVVEIVTDCAKLASAHLKMSALLAEQTLFFI